MRKAPISTSEQTHSSLTDTSLTAEQVIRDIKARARTHPANDPTRFFKVAKGEYGYGDTFIGISVPDIRQIAKRYRTLSQREMSVLITHVIHEVRVCGLLIAVYAIDDLKRVPDLQLRTYAHEQIYNRYVTHLASVNNWDLVDSSAYQILGSYLYTYVSDPYQTLARYAKSTSIWERRIAIIATFYAIRIGHVSDTYRVALLLLTDSEDLIHKAVGWMLREAGKKNESQLIAFLNDHAPHMPRTMLRYAIERLPQSIRQRYLSRS